MLRRMHNERKWKKGGREGGREGVGREVGLERNGTRRNICQQRAQPKKKKQQE